MLKGLHTFWRSVLRCQFALNAICLLSAGSLYGQEVSDTLLIQQKGQLSLWENSNFSYAPHLYLGGRFIPQLELEKGFKGSSLSVSAEASAVFQGQLSTLPFDSLGSSGSADPYRLWVRLSGRQFELRLGLQKINFGASSILRPLRWFDQIDPRDPLQITRGVYGLLGKYTWINNANLWVWGLYGNHDLKGWESLRSKRGVPEWGGRFQYPIPRGEFALSYHHRQANGELLGEETVAENRYGADAKWDLGFGLWLESSYSRFAFGQPLQQLLLLGGADYTLGLGNGLNLGVEHLWFSAGESLGANSQQFHFSALLGSYPIDFFNNLSLMLYYDWANRGLYRFLNYQREIGLGSLYVMGYWNPELAVGFQGNQASALAYAGVGMQLMWVVNY